MLKHKNIKLKKTHNKYKFSGKVNFFIKSHFLLSVYHKFEHMPYKSKKWLFRRLSRRRYVPNYRKAFVLFSNLNLNIITKNKLDPFYFLFYRFNYIKLYCLEYYLLTDFHLELIRRLARKLFGKKIFINLLIVAHKTLLRRANQMRMGGGKGVKISKKIYLLYPGCSFIEIRGLTKRMVIIFERKLKKK